MSADTPFLLNGTTGVAIRGRGLLIEGPPGCGKSSLALALIDRGAVLIGDDGVELTRTATRIVAMPPPRITGLLEIRNVGLVRMPVASAPVALIVRLDQAAPRLPEVVLQREVLGRPLPVVRLWSEGEPPALRTEYALAVHGLAP